MMERIAEASPRLKARIAGVFYLLVFVTAEPAPNGHQGIYSIANLIAIACYLVVTLLFYDLFSR